MTTPQLFSAVTKWPKYRLTGETVTSVFTARAYARAVLGVVILSVGLSVRLIHGALTEWNVLRGVCYTRGL